MPVYKYKNTDVVKELTGLERDLGLDPEGMAKFLGISFHQYAKFRSGRHAPGVSVTYRIGYVRGLLARMHDSDVTRMVINETIPNLRLVE